MSKVQSIANKFHRTPPETSAIRRTPVFNGSFNDYLRRRAMIAEMNRADAEIISDGGDTMSRSYEHDPMRITPRELTSNDRERLHSLKTRGAELYRFIEEIEYEVTSGYREFGKARESIEEAIMWATKGLTG